jgi:hypothetical protein
MSNDGTKKAINFFKKESWEKKLSKEEPIKKNQS